MTTAAFLARTIGIVVLFAALGPAVAGVLFDLLVAVLKPPPGQGMLGSLTFALPLLADSVVWVFVYAVGLGSAAATGLLYALWDAAAPARAPRALVAALLGGLITYGFVWSLTAIVASLPHLIDPNFSNSGAELSKGLSELIGEAFRPALAGVAALGSFVCAFVANLAGLSARPDAMSREPSLPSSGAA